jgi:hypothetical protein
MVRYGMILPERKTSETTKMIDSGVDKPWNRTGCTAVERTWASKYAMKKKYMSMWACNPPIACPS